MLNYNGIYIINIFLIMILEKHNEQTVSIKKLSNNETILIMFLLEDRMSYEIL